MALVTTTNLQFPAIIRTIALVSVAVTFSEPPPTSGQIWPQGKKVTA